ncbi:hypothetical protein M1L60_38340 [Actinoplanes sp. TRM 88003]|uniref:Uncharacterized protein n=1 Tax=Paractinoplanes aksuensis TaxID=2939490 RepID=A0ABT1E026_9ACTN|nr:hypothetical protein [Actinoplanes aksuensis]MCO8276454.1 hypothetical protein [Actinoplanes aksuensis]
MPLFSRAFAVSLLLLLLPMQPAAAAPTTATLQPHLTPVTMAPQSPTAFSPLWVTSENAEPGLPVRLEVTIDLGGATTFATVEVDDDTHCVRADEKITCSWTVTPWSDEINQFPAELSVTPRPTAKVGDRADLTMTARIGDGAVTTATSVIRIGEAVDLVTDEEQTVKAAPGRTVRTTPAVGNNGATVIDGVALIVVAHPRLLGATSYQNCRYSVFMLCTFDTELEPGHRYGLASPLALTSPGDTVPGSVAPVYVAWLTPTEMADSLDGEEYGTPGTGAPLRLKPMATAQDADPQVDVDPDNNAGRIVFTVTGQRKPSLAAVGSRVTAATGEHRVLTTGVMNFGPGTLRPELFPNNGLAVTVRLPGNVAAAGDTDCSGREDDEDSLEPSSPASQPATGGEWSCRLTQDLGPAQRASFPFRVLVTDECGPPGQVQVVPDSDGIVGRGKKVVPLLVNVAGATCTAVALPITGPAAGWTALAAVGLIGAGLILVRRRHRSFPQAHK